MVAAVSTDDGTLRRGTDPDQHQAPTRERGADGPIRRAALIGDIGGHASELDAALVGLGCDTATGTVPTDLLVIQLGDLVDRGPDPAAAVRLADRFIRHAGGRYLQLFGNHEGQRFTDLHLRHAGPLPQETLDTIHRWWTDGRAHLAVALDTQEFGPLLITHAGLSPQVWRDLGAPATAEQTAGAHRPVGGTRRRPRLHPGPDDHGRRVPPRGDLGRTGRRLHGLVGRGGPAAVRTGPRPCLGLVLEAPPLAQTDPRRGPGRRRRRRRRPVPRPGPDRWPGLRRHRPRPPGGAPPTVGPAPPDDRPGASAPATDGPDRGHRVPPDR